jgi:penicillin-binding protein 1A
VDKGYDKQGSKGWGKYITVSSTVTDEKMTVDGETWPLNYSRTYTGWNNFKTALQKSINTCAVKILVQVGEDYSMDMLKKYGVTSAIDDTSEPYNDVNLAALGLGAMTEGISPLEMSEAFAVFPNAGVRNSPICYTRVEDRNGNVILESESETERVLDEGVAWIMTNTLQSVITEGIAYDARLDGVAAGGKTGTTNDVYDIWFNGFTPTYAASLWIGTDNNVEMITDSTTAAKLWGRIMNQLNRAKEGSYPSMPGNVVVKDGQYYTYGTEPPDPPPEKKKDSKKSDKNSKDKDKKSGSSKDKDDDDDDD